MASGEQHGLRQLFEQLDKDGSGFIEQGELDHFLELIGVNDPEERAAQLPSLLERMDKDGDGRVSFEDFSETAVAMGLRPDSPDVVRAVQRDLALRIFDEGDTNGDGLLDSHELLNLLMSLGVSDPHYRQQLAEAVLREQNAESSGLTREQFAASALGGELETVLHSTVQDETYTAASRLGDSPLIQRRLLSTSSMSSEPPLTEVTRELDPSRRRLMWQIFNAADEDGNGTINASELQAVLQDKTLLGDASLSFSGGENGEDTLSEKVLRQLDASGDGALDFDEFCAAFADVIQVSSKRSSLMVANAQALMEENKSMRKSLQAERLEREHLERQLQQHSRDTKLQLTQAQESADAELSAANACITRLEAEGASLRNELREAKATIAELEEAAAHDGSRGGIDSRDKGRSSPQHQLLVLEQEMVALRSRCESLESALTAANQAEESYKRDIGENRERMLQLKADKEQMAVTISALRQELQDLLDSRSTATEKHASESAPSLGSSLALEELKAKLQAQQDLCFELTNERDSLLARLADQESGANASTTADGNSSVLMQQTIEELHRQIDDLTKSKNEHEETANSLREQIVETEEERSRLDDEKKEVREMRQDMEALQAMVVAQTAQLSIQQSPTEEIQRLSKEMELQRDLRAKAERRAEAATIEREQLNRELKQVQGALQRERTQRTKLQGQVLQAQNRGSSDLLETQGAQSGGTLIASKYITQIARLEADLRRLKSENKKLKKSKASAKSPITPTQLRDLRKGLADACAEVARLSLELDKLRDGENGPAVQVSQDRLHRLEDMLQEREKEVQRLTAMHRDADSRLQMAHETIRMMKEQARVQVSVKKETLHTREKRGGEFVPVSKKEENSTVTWFTDERSKTIKTGPWLPSEDRILLQAQLQLGDDWLEMAKVLPGRTDESIANRWKQLTAALRTGEESLQRQPSADRNKIQRQASEHIYAEPAGNETEEQATSPYYTEPAAKPATNAAAEAAAAASSTYEEAMPELRNPRNDRPVPLKHTSSRGGSMVAVI